MCFLRTRRQADHAHHIREPSKGFLGKAGYYSKYHKGMTQDKFCVREVVAAADWSIDERASIEVKIIYKTYIIICLKNIQAFHSVRG